jgi:hypothetical protein
MKRLLFLGALFLLLAGCAGQADLQQEDSSSIVVYKSPT